VERERAARIFMNFIVARVEGIKNGTTEDE
jgi:hypothetical protein